MKRVICFLLSIIMISVCACAKQGATESESTSMESKNNNNAEISKEISELDKGSYETSEPDEISEDIPTDISNDTVSDESNPDKAEQLTLPDFSTMVLSE